jgi:hypothetical protein
MSLSDLTTRPPTFSPLDGVLSQKPDTTEMVK